MLFRRKRVGPPSRPPPLQWEATADPAGRFSTGIRDLDALLGGGYACGSAVAIEGEASVLPDDVLQIVLPTVFNFLKRGRGAIVVPPAGVPRSRIRDEALRCLSPELFEARVRVVDYTTIDTREPWVVPLARYGRAEMIRAMVKAEEAARGASGGHFLELTALDTIENQLGPESASRMVTYGLGRAKEVGNLALAWFRSGANGAQGVAGMTEVHLTLSRRPTGLSVRGIRPAFPARLIDWSAAGGCLRVGLGLPD
ncbi:MAG: hypothetical protein L3K09_06575 [Thermoplasmata archaeon]|nr:hypothetical protein [Thermoplasmata archaeon]